MVNKYLFSAFLGSFWSLFSTLFIIVSIVFFIQIAKITSYVSINLAELIKLYLFLLPQILLFTLPISFFVALAISLFRLSKENEIIVIFTLGHTAQKISKFFSIFALILSAFLLFASLILMPISENLRDNFLDYKINVAQLNIKASEFGQRFSDWMVFVGSENKGKNNTNYKNVILYHPKKDDANERVIVAKSANIVNKNGQIELNLFDGYGYDIAKDLIHSAKFNDMTIRTRPNGELGANYSLRQYWSEISTNNYRKKDLSMAVLVALFPLASLHFALSFGIVTYRYEKGFVYFGIFGVLIVYFSLLGALIMKPFIAIPFVFLLTFIGSLVYFKLKILSRY